MSYSSGLFCHEFCCPWCVGALQHKGFIFRCKLKRCQSDTQVQIVFSRVKTPGLGMGGTRARDCGLMSRCRCYVSTRRKVFYFLSIHGLTQHQAIEWQCGEWRVSGIASCITFIITIHTQYITVPSILSILYLNSVRAAQCSRDPSVGGGGVWGGVGWGWGVSRGGGEAGREGGGVSRHGCGWTGAGQTTTRWV